MERLDPNRPDFPLLPLHCRRFARALLPIEAETGRFHSIAGLAHGKAQPDDLRSRPVVEWTSPLPSGDLENPRRSATNCALLLRRCDDHAVLQNLRTRVMDCSHSGRLLAPDAICAGARIRVA